jgi:hypothetical protein
MMLSLASFNGGIQIQKPAGCSIDIGTAPRNRHWLAFRLIVAL